ncbi:MAG: DUF3048 C-terminal domain-containing protein, partial [Anaerolineales bacterium]|nr:DUF3048 C-terminal domain-containing protein [Anaerolineales bacterium]
MRFSSKLLVFSLSIILVLSGCRAPIPANLVNNAPDEVVVTTEESLATEAVVETSAPVEVIAAAPEVAQTEQPAGQPTEETQPTTEATTQALPNPTQAPFYSVGPDNFPDGVNPLTGLMVADPSILRYPPALISVSNFPASARPQYGLSTSPLVFEMAIGEGMTRFLSVFYGAFPSAVSGQTEGNAVSGGTSSSTAPAAAGQIGPIRSGRLPYETMRAQMNGFLVMASAYKGVAATLNSATSIFGSDASDINSALIGIDQLEKIAQAQYEKNGKSPFLDGMYFNTEVPEGGSPADKAWVYYSNLNQIQWDYDTELGAFVRSDISTDGKSTFTVSTDRLNDLPLAKENVIVLFADHDYRAPTLIQIDLNNVIKGKAILFRDGQAFEIFWTSQYGDFEKSTGLLRPIRFMDADGNPFPLKPGETWIEIVSLASRAWESDPTRFPFNAYSEQPDSGLWAIRYYGKY